MSKSFVSTGLPDLGRLTAEAEDAFELRQKFLDWNRDGPAKVYIGREYAVFEKVVALLRESAASSPSCIHAPGAQNPMDVDVLANFIRSVDGDHKMGAGKLAEKIAERFAVLVATAEVPAVAFASDGREPDWNAHAAAELAVGVEAGQVVVMEGWKWVPNEPTLDMVTNGFESAPDEFFSPAEEWEAYVEMTGCQQAAHRARLCYAAMLAAAPAAPAQAKPLPTDISRQLREYATNPGYSHNDYADTMRQAAEEIERYYGGMMNWKANAQAKDRVNVEAWAHKVEVARATGLEEARQECESVLWAIENGDGMPDEVYGAERCRDAIKAIQCPAQASTAGGRQGGGQS